MANKEKIRARRPFGHVGSLLYLPYEGDDGGVGTFETTRKLVDPPECRIIHPFEVVKPAPRISNVEPANEVTYAEKRVQERWLRNTLPEAALGNTPIFELLGDSQHQPNPRGATQQNVPAAAGEISDYRNPWRLTSAPSLAMAAGEGGQILRILRLSEYPWLWTDHDDVALRTWDLKPADREEEAFWCQGAAPITRIKYFTHLESYAPLRWLIVQTQSSTTILSPVYHSVPVAYLNAALDDRPVSRIDPNEILSFTLKHTKGRRHIDVSINPPSHDSPLQVALIDGHGGWSIWNVSGDLTTTNSSPKPTLFKRGNFWDNLPDEERGGFGILWYRSLSKDRSSSPGQGFASNEDLGSFAGFSSTAIDLPRHSHTLLLWNHSTIQVLDASTGSVYSYIAITQRSPKKERILQIQSNPSDPSQALVLTTHSMMCLDICPGGEHERETPHIVHAYLHDHPGDPTLQFSASRSAKDSNAAFVLIFPKDGPRVSIFWFYGSGDGKLGQFSHQLQFLRQEDSNELDSLRTLCVLPMRLAPYRTESSSGPGSMYRYLDIEFQQIVSIGRRQSLGYWISATVTRGADEILSPEPWKSSGREGERDPAEVEQIKRRVAYLNYMADRFVVPDCFEDVDVFVAPRKSEDTQVEDSFLEFEPLPSVKREILIKRRFHPYVALEAYRALFAQPGMLRRESLEVVRQMLQAGLRSQQIPRRSLLECVQIDSNNQAIVNGVNGANGASDPSDDIEWGQQLTEAVEDGMGTLSLKDVNIDPPWQTGDFAEKLASAKHWLADYWPVPAEETHPEAAAQRRAILEETALQVVLAYHTIEVKDPFQGSQTTAIASQSSFVPFSSQTTFGYGSQLSSSQPSLPSLPSSSQPMSQSSSQKEARRVADKKASLAAISRLSSLATNLNEDANLSTLTQHPILGRWNEAGNEDYVPFIQKPAEAKEERLRLKRQKNVERRKAKEETFNRLTGRSVTASSPPRNTGGGSSQGAANLSQGASIPLRGTGPELMSSQTQITMSQPVGGAFGQRSKKKKKKGGIK